MPEYTLGPDFGTAQPDTLVLDAGSGYATYYWMDGLGTAQTFNLNSAGIYWVKVTNDSNCVARDTIEIILSDADLGIDSVLNLDSACEIPAPVYPEVIITNYGPDSLFTGDTILIGYIVNNGIAKIDTVELGDSLFPDSSMNYTYQQSYNFSAVKSYNIEFFTAYWGDIDLSNDTLDYPIEVFGYPDVNLTVDTIFTTQPDTLIFDAGAGFATYLWQDASINQTYDVSALTSQLYKVTVTDDHGCGQDSDSVFVVTDDPGIVSVVSPVSSCELSDTESIVIRVKNYGYDVYPTGDTIKLNIKVNNGQNIPVKYELISDFEYNDSIDVIVDSLFDFHTPGTYQIAAELLTVWDADTLNNEASNTVRVWGYPEFDLGPDTFLTNAPTSVELTTVPGYDYYLWQDSSTEENYKVTDPSSQLYFVTVSDLHSCSTSDTLQIISYDVGISGLDNPVNSCELSDNEEISVIFINNCYDTLPEGDSIKLALTFAGSEIIEETHILNDTLCPGENMIHIFTPVFDLTTVGSYNYTVYLISGIDVMSNNDTLQGTVNVWGYPDVELGIDTIFTTQADTLYFDAGSGFKTYEWQDGTLTQTYNVSNLNSNIYKVTVTDFHNCGADSDSIVVVTYNIIADSIISPSNSCELTNNENITISVKNTGADSIITGETVYVLYSINGGMPVLESFNLSNTLFSDSSVIYTFLQKADFSVEGDYIIHALAYLNNDAEKQDTLVDTITVYGYPQIELGDDISTLQPDTVTIDAGGSYFSYTWNEGTNGAVLNVTKLSSFLYKVTVSNDFGCETTDSIKINSGDISLNEITQPVDTCIYFENQQIEVRIINSCHDTILPGDTIYLNYRLNTGQLYIDTNVFNKEFYPGDSIIIISKNSFNMQQPGIYAVNAYINCEANINHENDTLVKEIEIYGNPVVDLGPEITYTARADTIILNAGSGFKEYLWQDASVLSTFSITILDSATYSVTVTDENNCIAYDELVIMSYNIGIQSINVPGSNCELSNVEEASLEIVNKGNTGIYAGDSLIFNYILNEEPVKEKIILVEDLFPDKTLEYTFVQKMDMSIPGEYNLEIYISKDFDYNLQDDTLKQIIEVYGNPDIDLGEDTIYTGKADTIEFILNSQYDTYLWQDSSANSYYAVTNLASSKYAVTVTSDKNCITEDEIIVMSYDLDLQSVNFPESDCELSESEEISLVILNAGNTSILPGDYVIVDYHIKELHNSEKIVFTDTLKPSENYNYIINEKIDMSGIGKYNMIININKEYDYNDENDSMSENLEVYGYPEVNLGGDAEDKLHVTLPYWLSPNGDFNTYLWHDGITDEEYKIRYEGWVKVTVTDENNCPGSDSVYIVINTDDIKELLKDIYTFDVFPNPANNNLYIKLPTQTDSEFIIEIIDITGKVAYTSKYILYWNENNLINIGVSEFPSGLYILRIISMNSQKVYKVILQ